MNDLDKFHPQRLGKSGLYSTIEKMAIQAGCVVHKLDYEEEKTPFVPYEIKIACNTSLTVHIYAKNISGAGWADKPEIKRIQINKLPEIPRQKRNDFYILCGVCNYDSQTVVAAWDPLNYTTHNTCCSCYVYVSSLEKAVRNGLFFGLNKGKEVMTCSDRSFGDLLKEISSRFY